MGILDFREMSRRLIAGMEIQDFNRDVREREAMRFGNAMNPLTLGELFGLSRLESALSNDQIPKEFIDVFSGGQLAKLVDLHPNTGSSSLESVAEKLQFGATLRVRDVQKFDARLNHFTEEVQRLFAAQSQINVYLTPPGQKGFPPHFDITDVFVVQCVGQKEWKVFDEYTEKSELPLMGTQWEPNLYRPSDSFEAMTLNPGDVLYLPRGTMHQALCKHRESMHLTISIVPLTVADVLVSEVMRIAAGSVELRRRVPWTLSSGVDEFGALTSQMRAQLIEIANQIDIEEALKEEQRLLASDADLPTGGVLEAAIAASVDRLERTST